MTGEQGPGRRVSLIRADVVADQGDERTTRPAWAEAQTAWFRPAARLPARAARARDLGPSGCQPPHDEVGSSAHDLRTFRFGRVPLPASSTEDISSPVAT